MINRLHYLIENAVKTHCTLTQYKQRKVSNAYNPTVISLAQRILITLQYQLNLYIGQVPLIIPFSWRLQDLIDIILRLRTIIVGDIHISHLWIIFCFATAHQLRTFTVGQIVSLLSSEHYEFLLKELDYIE